MALLKKPFKVGWAVLILAGLGLEALALANNRDEDTLSEQVWQTFSVNHEGKQARARRFILLTLMSWLFWHFWTGGKKV